MTHWFMNGWVVGAIFVTAAIRIAMTISQKPPQEAEMNKTPFHTDRDYEVTFQVPGMHDKPVITRAGFIGPTDDQKGLQFDLRPAAGTMSIMRAWISEATIVPRVKVRRYAPKDTGK